MAPPSRLRTKFNNREKMARNTTINKARNREENKKNKSNHIKTSNYKPASNFTNRQRFFKNN